MTVISGRKQRESDRDREIETETDRQRHREEGAWFLRPINHDCYIKAKTETDRHTDRDRQTQTDTHRHTKDLGFYAQSTVTAISRRKHRERTVLRHWSQLVPNMSHDI